MYAGKILEGFTLAHRAAEEKKVGPVQHPRTPGSGFNKVRCLLRTTFQADLQMSSCLQIFPPPTLPRNYRPVHRTRPSLQLLSGVSPVLAEALRTSRGHMVKEDPEPGGRHQLAAGQRAALLGEDALKGGGSGSVRSCHTHVSHNKPSSCPGSKPGPVSVLELLRPEDRQRILSLRSPSTQASQNAPLQVASPVVGGAASSGLQQEALAAWRGVQTSDQTFRPFEKNPSKQARYELFLARLRQGDKGETLKPGGGPETGP